MYSIHVIIVLIPILWQKIICDQGQLQSEIRFTKATNCDITRLKWKLQNISISFVYPRTYINGILNVTEDVKKLKRVLVHVDRCNDQGFNCEDFQSWNFDNFCDLLTWRNQLWSGFTDSLHPPFRCPIKKGIYQGRNATVDFSVALKWYPEFVKYHWNYLVKFINESDELVFCAHFNGHVYQYRKRNRKTYN